MSVQLLSHQFKIASQVELFIGTLPHGVEPPANGTEGASFVRLGHFSLDSNERSKYQARELKTVYVPQATEGHYLRLVLHKCHVNEHNLHKNQNQRHNQNLLLLLPKKEVDHSQKK